MIKGNLFSSLLPHDQYVILPVIDLQSYYFEDDLDATRLTRKGMLSFGSNKDLIIEIYGSEMRTIESHSSLQLPWVRLPGQRMQAQIRSSQSDLWVDM